MLLLNLDPPLFSHCFTVCCSCSFWAPHCNTRCEWSGQGWGIQELWISHWRRGWDIARDASCPAKGHRCSKCKKQNHFEDVCRSSKQKAANFVCNEEYEEEDRDDYLAFNITDEKQNDVASISSARTDACIVKVQIDGVDCEALIDSGSSADVLWDNVLRCLRNDGHCNKCLEASQSRLYAYGNTELPVVGKFSSGISFAGKATNTSIVVIAGKGRCLLGWSTVRELGLLRTGPEEGHVNATDEDADQFAGDMRKKFPEVFTGVGCLRDYQLQLHMDLSDTPVAQKHRRVPFALCEIVSEKIKDLIEKDIIEEVPGPTTWASPIVVSPKASGDIRLCIDMRLANTAIQLERLPILTVDEALEDVNRSAVFTKLDFNFGFHQIELAESSRDVTTFCTQGGLYRYNCKRLSFGAKARPKKFQHIIRQVLADCPGTVNIAEDIVVHGRTTEKHDRSLLKVLHIERLHERGMTLNSKKCNLRMPRVEFMGFLPSVHGIGLSDGRESTRHPSKNIYSWLPRTPCRPLFKLVTSWKHQPSIKNSPTSDSDWRLTTGPTPRKHTRHRHEFTFIGQFIMRGTHIALPSLLRSGVLQIAHEGHLDMVKVKTWQLGLVAQHRQRCGNDLPHMHLLPGCGTAASAATFCRAYAVPVTTVVRTRRRDLWSTPVR